MRPITVSQTGTGQSSSIIMDYLGRPEVSLQVIVSGTVTYSVQQTLNNPNDASQTITWFDHPDTNLVGATADKQGNYAYIPAAIRLNVTAGTGTATLTVIQAGLKG